jgi:hypothetical protein
VLARGGVGLARALNDLVGSWPGVSVTALFGRWGYFVGPRLFACFPLRGRQHDLWVRLGPADQGRALRHPGVRPHRRLAREGWVEMTVRAPEDLARAVRWLRLAWQTACAPGGAEAH